MNESCHIALRLGEMCDRTHVQVCDVTHVQVCDVTMIKRSFTRKGHGTHMNESCHTPERVMANT